MIAWTVLQSLLVFSTTGDEPVRFGCPVPRDVVAKGLGVRGHGSVQWRVLGAPSPHAERIWVEVAFQGPPGRHVLVVGSAGGPKSQIVEVDRTDQEGVKRTVWRYRGGGECWRESQRMAGEDGYHQGELRVCHSQGFEDVWARVTISAGEWRRVGLLEGARAASRDSRRRLLGSAERLRDLPGARGRGDFARGEEGETVTNLEFDTTLALAFACLGSGDRGLLRRAWASAWHSVTVDRDGRTGLMFPHGPDHRSGRPEPGHVWLSGVLLVGLLTADDDLIDAALSVGRSLVRQPPAGEGRSERARDYGWPLWELERLLAWQHDPQLARAADAMALALTDRFDERLKVFRFGEGEALRGRSYRERAWITGGILLPGLQAHLRRRPSRRGATIVRSAQERLLAVVLDGRDGLPASYRLSEAGAVFGRAGVVEDPRLWMMLEGLTPAQRSRCLRRRTVARAMGELPLEDDTDLPTTWTMIARNRWLWGVAW